ncbi:MAG: hypothetical protein AAGC74_10355 [Verrucomicrobiota bacterium]
MRWTGVTFLMMSMGVFSQVEIEDGHMVVKRPVPQAVVSEAVSAVQTLGNETLKGNVGFVFERMYPRLRKREAKRMGGEELLKAKIESVPDEMARLGVQLLGFQAEPAFHGFEIPEFDEWLVFVPTSRRIRGVDSKTGRPMEYEVSDYQVAIRKKAAGAEWTFINGSTLKVQDLRSLFPSLPADEEDLGLPELSSRKLR